jgi:hypothetical protein
MNEIKQVLQAALPQTSPPSAITSASAIAAGRELRRRRQATAATVAAGLAVVLLLATVAWLREPTHPAGAGVGAPPSVTDYPTAIPGPTLGPTPPDAPVLTRPAVTDPAQLLNIAPRLTTALFTATAQVAPGLRLGPVKGTFAGFTLAPYQTVKSQGGIKTWAVLSDAAGPGTLFLEFDPGGDVEQPPTCGPNPAPGCSTRLGPAQEPIEVTERTDGSLRYTEIALVRTDGTQVYAALNNYSQTDQPTSHLLHAQRTNQILSVEQLLQIMLAPGVTIPPGVDLQS